MLVYQIGIKPCASGFGEWEINPNSDNDPDMAIDLSDLLSNLDEFYLLGADELPDDIEDIRGKIHDEPMRVFAVRQAWGVEYFGIEKCE